jgi:hypothetical protein
MGIKSRTKGFCMMGVNKFTAVVQGGTKALESKSRPAKKIYGDQTENERLLHDGNKQIYGHCSRWNEGVVAPAARKIFLTVAARRQYASTASK